MEQHDREELAEVNAARKGFYEFLASMYKLELTDEQIGTLTKQDLPTDAEYVGAGYATVKEYLRHRDSGTRQELAVDYARVFLCAGMYEQLMAPPYESVYTSEEHLLMQDARDSAVAFYLGEELGLPADNTTPEDHLSFEFQFMAKLIERAGAALDAGDEARYAEHTRRAFAGFCGAAAAFAAFGGAVKAADGASETALVRPPGAQDELRLLASCVKCDRCRSVCHTGVIGVAEVGDGFLRARTPKLNFHRGSCDFCGDCQRVCPTGAIGAFDPEADKMGMAVVQKDRCVAYYQGCVECQKACPFEAIALDGDGHPVVDADRCNGCGVCEDVCPALVYRSFSGGTRRGIVVVSPSAYARLGKTVVEDESEMSA